jgi:hypothetical protein
MTPSRVPSRRIWLHSSSNSKPRSGPIMTDNRTQVFDVAMKNARTIEACVDRLSMMGADHELKLVAQRLTRLTFRLRHQPSKVRKGWAQPQSSAA